MSERTYTLLTNPVASSQQPPKQRQVNILLLCFLTALLGLVIYYALPHGVEYVVSQWLPLYPPIKPVVALPRIATQDSFWMQFLRDSLTREPGDRFIPLVTTIFIVFMSFTLSLALGMVIWFVRSNMSVSLAAFRRWSIAFGSIVLLYSALIGYRTYQEHLLLQPGLKYHSVDVEEQTVRAVLPEGRFGNTTASALQGSIVKPTHTIAFKNCSFALIDNALFYYNARQECGYQRDFGSVRVRDMQWLPLRFGTNESPYMSLLFSFGAKNNRHLLMIFNHDKGLLYEYMLVDNSYLPTLKSATLPDTRQEMCYVVGEETHNFFPTDVEQEGKIRRTFEGTVFDSVVPLKAEKDSSR